MSQLTNYIQKELEKGFSEKLIKEKLVKAGYTEQEIKESFQSLKSAEPLLRRKLPEYLHTDVHVQWSKWVFPLLAVGAAVFFGYLVYLYAIGEVGVPTVEKKGCDVFVDEAERRACLWNEAVAAGDTTHCQGTDEKQAACYLEVAQFHNDVSLCDGFFSCVVEMAINANDAAYCEEVQDALRSECYDAYTQRTGDASVCDKGTEICQYPTLQTVEEKKVFIEQLIENADIEEREPSAEGRASEMDGILMDYAEKFQDPVFCLYVSKPFDEECREFVS